MVLQESEWVLAKKSDKCVMPSSMGDAHGFLKELSKIWFLVWGSGSKIFLDSRVANGAFQCFFDVQVSDLGTSET